jgi:hypothetical protein
MSSTSTPMRTRCHGALRVTSAVGFAVLLPACVFTSSTPTHPAVRNAPASYDESDASRTAAVLGAASRDLACERVEVVMEFHREFANSSQPSYVVQGCDKRAVYAMACGDYPRCAFLLLSVLELGSPAGGAAPAR